MTIASHATRIGIRALTQAQQYVGVHEQPPGSNDGPLIGAWLRNVGINYPAPWCAAFLWNMFARAGRRLPIPGAASVESWVKWGRAAGDLVRRPFKGDVVCYDWDSNGWFDHVGVVERVLALRWSSDGYFLGWIRVIEGNSGDAVSRRSRWCRGFRVQFIRIPD